MFELMLVEIFVNAAVLCLILFIVAKHEADYSFSKVAMTTAGISLGSFLITLFLADKIGWYSLIAIFAFSAFMIKTFCWLNVRKTIIVILLFCTFQVGSKVGIHFISQNYSAPKLPPSQSEQAYEVAKEMGLIDPDHTISKNSVPQKQPPAPQKEKKDKKIKLPKFKNPFSKEKTKLEPEAPETIDARWQEARKALSHEGTMLNSSGDYVAIVNGEIVEVGDTISKKFKSITYNWKITEISKHNINLKQLDTK